jgi:hypothetical protein
MSKGKKAAKKDFQRKIADQLSNTLTDLKERVGAKKFERRIQKAVKVLAQGVKVNVVEKPLKKKNVDKLKDVGGEKKLTTA